MEASGSWLLENLSVPARMLTDMSNRDCNDSETTIRIFSDPVGYLAEFGIDADLIADAIVPVAA
jgi:hypothetical protein